MGLRGGCEERDEHENEGRYNRLGSCDCGTRAQTTQRIMEARRRMDKEREAMARERELNDQDHNEEVNLAFSSLATLGTALHEPQDLVETFTAMREPDYTWGSLHLYRNHILFTSSMLSTQVRRVSRMCFGVQGGVRRFAGVAGKRDRCVSAWLRVALRRESVHQTADGFPNR
jgi:hypothetical protein